MDDTQLIIDFISIVAASLRIFLLNYSVQCFHFHSLLSECYAYSRFPIRLRHTSLSVIVILRYFKFVEISMFVETHFHDLERLVTLPLPE